MKREKVYLEFKYPSGPWQVYDWSMVLPWLEVQEQRMIQEHPGAEYRRRKDAQ